MVNADFWTFRKKRIDFVMIRIDMNIIYCLLSGVCTNEQYSTNESSTGEDISSYGWTRARGRCCFHLEPNANKAQWCSGQSCQGVRNKVNLDV